MNRLFKQFNIRDKKYGMPLIFLPLLLLFIVLFTKEEKGNGMEERQQISVNLGGSDAIEIGNKTDSYRQNRNLRGIDNQTIAGLDEEILTKDSIYTIPNNNDSKIDSLNDNLANLRKTAELHRLKLEEERNSRGTGYVPPSPDVQQSIAETQRKERELAELLNSQNNLQNTENLEQEDDGDVAVRAMREQIMLMDSLDRMNNPERKARMEQEAYQQQLDEQRDYFLNSNLKVTKVGSSNHFNTTFKSSKSHFIRAVIDEDITGYLGSRIRIRLLEDVYVGTTFLPKGSFLYSTIHGFSAQRVNLKIVSALIDDEILPINLEIYDVDGMQGLYVPRSVFREITEELTTQQLQGQQMPTTNDQNFYQSMASKAFTSTSRAITSLIKKHKAKVKYNTHLFLIDEKEMQDKRKAIYDQNKQ